MSAIEPFLKWPGGKRRFAASGMASMLPDDFCDRKYIEPMVGGGAAFYAHGTGAPSAILSDVNFRLIKAYEGVRDNPDGVLSKLDNMEYNEKGYYEARDFFNAYNLGSHPTKVAATMIFLNRTCYNGVYRENSKGAFNVPYGDGKVKALEGEVCRKIRAASEALQGVELRCSPLNKFLSWCPEGSFVFFDPPYVTEYQSVGGGSFTAYSAGRFTETDLRLLSGVSRLLARKRNCKIMITHSDVPVARDVFAWMNKRPVLSGYTVSRSGKSRGDVAELVFTSY